MKRADLVSAAIFLATGAFVCMGAVDLSLGSLRAPGPGLYPLVLGTVLGGAAIWLGATALRSPAGAPGGAAALPSHRGKVAGTVGALLTYAGALPWLGYPLATFGLLLVLFRIGGIRLGPALLFALAAALGSQLFAFGLRIPLPPGVLFPGG